METTKRKVTVRLTKEDARVLEELKKQLGENDSQTIRRALNLLHNKTQTQTQTHNKDLINAHN